MFKSFKFTSKVSNFMGYFFVKDDVIREYLAELASIRVKYFLLLFLNNVLIFLPGLILLIATNMIEKNNVAAIMLLVCYFISNIFVTLALNLLNKKEILMNEQDSCSLQRLISSILSYTRDKVPNGSKYFTVPEIIEKVEAYVCGLLDFQNQFFATIISLIVLILSSISTICSLLNNDVIYIFIIFALISALLLIKVMRDRGKFVKQYSERKKEINGKRSTTLRDVKEVVPMSSTHNEYMLANLFYHIKAYHQNEIAYIPENLTTKSNENQEKYLTFIIF